MYDLNMESLATARHRELTRNCELKHLCAVAARSQRTFVDVLLLAVGRRLVTAGRNIVEAVSQKTAL